MKVLCDICKTEYESENEDLSSDRNFKKEQTCPECQEDLEEI